jgi:hypothetical protein
MSILNARPTSELRDSPLSSRIRSTRRNKAASRLTAILAVFAMARRNHTIAAISHDCAKLASIDD